MNRPRPVIASASRSSVGSTASSPPDAIARVGTLPRSTTERRTASGSARSSTSKNAPSLCSVALVASSVTDRPTSSTRSVRPQPVRASSTNRRTAGTLDGCATMRTRVSTAPSAVPPPGEVTRALSGTNRLRAGVRADRSVHAGDGLVLLDGGVPLALAGPPALVVDAEPPVAGHRQPVERHAVPDPQVPPHLPDGAGLAVYEGLHVAARPGQVEQRGHQPLAGPAVAGVQPGDRDAG